MFLLAVGVASPGRPCHIRRMPRQPLDHLRAIVDLLGPNMWLQLDVVSFPRFFQISIDPDRDPTQAIEAGQAFAEQQGCVFLFDPETRVVTFGRAYFKRDSNA